MNEDERGNPNFDPTVDDTQTYPEGEYAIVEVMGHIRHVGRVTETERFGQKFCQVEPVHNEAMGPPILVGGASIYQFRPCTAEYAYESTQDWNYRDAKNPPKQLPAPTHGSEDDLDNIPFDPDFAEVE